MRWIRILAAVVGVLAIAMVGVVVFVASLDINDFRGEIEDAVTEATGRKVRVDGDLSLTWTPRPTFTADGLRVANAPWGSRADMAVVGRLEAAVELMPLLAGRTDVQRIVLKDVEVLLERGADGAGNWATASSGGAPGTHETGGEAPVLRAVDLDDVSILWKEAPGVDPRRYHIKKLHLSADGAAAPLTVAFEADLDGDAVVLEGTIPAIAEALRPGATLPVDLAGSLGDKSVRLAANLRYALDATGSLHTLTADRLSLELGEIAGGGDATLTLGGARPRLEAVLKSDRIVYADAGAAKDADPLERPLPAALLRAVDAKIALTVASLTAKGVEARDVHVTAILDAGVLTLDPLLATVSDGKAVATARLDASAATPAVAVAATWTGADFGKLAHLLHGSDTLEAKGDASVDLTATGPTGRDLLNTLGGVAWITTEGGHLGNEDWELVAEDLTGRFLPFLSEGDSGRMNCGVGRWTIKRGVAEAVILLVDSDRVTVAGEGRIDLAAEKIDMKLVPSPKDASLFSLATPLLFTGDLRDPTISPDPVAVAKGVGSLFAGTAIAGPLALMLPFVSSGSGEPACVEALAIAEGRKAPATGGGGSTEPKNKPGGIKGLFDSLRRAVE